MCLWEMGHSNKKQIQHFVEPVVFNFFWIRKGDRKLIKSFESYELVLESTPTPMIPIMANEGLYRDSLLKMYSWWWRLHPKFPTWVVSKLGPSNIISIGCVFFLLKGHLPNVPLTWPTCPPSRYRLISPLISINHWESVLDAQLIIGVLSSRLL